MLKKARVGLSLSFCIKDVVSGRHAEIWTEAGMFILPVASDFYIISGTKIRDEKDLALVAEQYAKIYWSEFPTKAVALLYTLYNQGRIIQPKLYGSAPPNLERGHWQEALGVDGYPHCGDYY